MPHWSARILPCSLSLVAAVALATIAPTTAQADDANLGLMADIGVPDGFVGALTYRAHNRVELHAGGGHNSVSPGLRAGLQVSAVSAAVSPYAAVEVGHYFSGKATPWIQSLAAQAGMHAVELDSVGYSYGNAHLGLRLGGDTAAVFVQGGMSVVEVKATLRANDIPVSSAQNIDGAIDFQASRRWTPSGRIGMIAFF